VNTQVFPDQLGRWHYIVVEKEYEVAGCAP
jgi:hypothetical protein